MAEITMTTIIEDRELWSRVFGGGWEYMGDWFTECEWLDETDWDVPGEVRLTCRNEDDEEVTKVVTLADLVAAIGKCPPHITAEIVNDEVDAVVSDYVLQVAVLGECVFG